MKFLAPLIICVVCVLFILTRRKVCPHCSAAVKISLLPANPEQFRSGLRTCPNCGKELAFRDTDGEQAAATAKVYGTMVLAVSSIAAAVALAFLFFFLFNPAQGLRFASLQGIMLPVLGTGLLVASVMLANESYAVMRLKADSHKALVTLLLADLLALALFSADLHLYLTAHDLRVPLLSGIENTGAFLFVMLLYFLLTVPKKVRAE